MEQAVARDRPLQDDCDRHLLRQAGGQGQGRHLLPGTEKKQFSVYL